MFDLAGLFKYKCRYDKQKVVGVSEKCIVHVPVNAYFNLLQNSNCPKISNYISYIFLPKLLCLFNKILVRMANSADPDQTIP